MPKNIVKKNSLAIKGIVSVDEDKIMFEIEGCDEPVNFATYMSDFDGQEVSISVNQQTEIA